MAQKKPKTTKPTAAKAKAPAEKKPRQLRISKYKSFRLQKRIKPEVVVPKQMKAAPKLFLTACKVLGRHWKLFAGILLIYAVLNITLIGGLSSGDLQSMHDNLHDIFTGHFAELTGGLAIFAVLISSAATGGSGTTSAYQALMLLVVSLGLIWALRQAYAGHKVRIRDAFYKGMYPLVPFVLVLVVIFLQLLPLILGLAEFNVLVSTGIAATAIEQIACGIIAFLLAVLSLYMVTSSIFALYVVTLPDMTPMKALRSARELVRYRRVKVLRKLLFLPLAITIFLAIIMVPLIIFVTPIATIMFFLLSTIAVAIVHSYIYGMYRELIA